MQKRKLQNRSYKSKLRTMKNCYSKLLKEEKKEEASLYLRSLESFISKLKNKGILHRKTAQRSISRSALKLNRSN